MLLLDPRTEPFNVLTLLNILQHRHRQPLGHSIKDSSPSCCPPLSIVSIHAHGKPCYKRCTLHHIISLAMTPRGRDAAASIRRQSAVITSHHLFHVFVKKFRLTWYRHASSSLSCRESTIITTVIVAAYASLIAQAMLGMRVSAPRYSRQYKPQRAGGKLTTSFVYRPPRHSGPNASTTPWPGPRCPAPHTPPPQAPSHRPRRHQ